MITIQHSITDPSGLSAAGSLLIGWLPGANQWLNKAILERNKHYSFNSEASLISSILNGLYSSELMVLRSCKFRAAPDFLLNMSIEQLTIIDQVMKGESNRSLSEKLSSLIAENGIISDQHANDVKNQLVQWNIDHESCFTALSLMDVRSLSHLITTVDKAGYPQVVIDGALSFAAQRSADARSFAQMAEYACKAYSILFSASTSSNLTTTTKSKFTSIYNNLMPFALDRLVCPQLHSPQTSKDAAQELSNWGRHQHFVGFTDLTTALQQFTNNLDFSQLTNNEKAAKQMIKFDNTVTEFLRRMKVTGQRLSQDAKTWYLDASSGSQRAEFALAEDGCLTLNSFFNKLT